ncbi:hypothetical protein [Salinibacter ruber]|uniref:hypothetical protein n=1 Tax=Salinibacter ruber TaxID=146919 RepID=UPI0021697CBD|nr:hypothetical protein [Salinibacter ruber]MCS4056827.1 hypothetical protein [Salinibacter ruber]
MLPYVRQPTRVLSERLGWNRARMKLMARLMRVLPMQTTTSLAELAVVMKPEVETDSTYRRLQRFFAGFEFGYQRLGRFLLDLVPTDPPYVAVLDRTEWHFGQKAVNVLMIGIAKGGIAYPVAWSVLEHGGGSGADKHTELLKQFLRLKKDRRVGPPSGEWSLPVKMFARACQPEQTSQLPAPNRWNVRSLSGTWKRIRF